MTSTAHEKQQRSKSRQWVLKRTVVAFLGVTLWGFLIGVLTGGSGRYVSGVAVAVIAAVLTLIALAVVYRLEFRRARRFGLSLGQYLRIGQEIRHARLPADPAARPAVLDIVERQRKTLDQQRRRRWVRISLIIMWSLIAVINVVDGSYGYAALMLTGIVAVLSVPHSLRRQERRLDAVERALGRRPQSPPA